ncbi:MAG: ABC transporter ATP-binding protein [Streptomycetales bacterium]
MSDRRRLAARFTRRFPGGQQVVAELDVPLDRPAVTVLFGPSGSGKTTILRCLAGLDSIDEGRLTYGEELWEDAERAVRRSPQRRRIGYLAQDYALFPHLSVARNIAYGLRRLPVRQRAGRVAEMLRMLRLHGLADRRPAQLSGGQAQRVALARALAPYPRLLLLDEPLSALDTPTREELRGELRAVLAGLDVPSLLVTHDRTEALALGDAMVVVVDGRVRQTGPVDQVFTRPADLDVARVVGVESVLPGRVVRVDAEGLATVDVGGRGLVAVTPPAEAHEVFACVRAEDVALEPRGFHLTSARNRFRAQVTTTVPEGPLVRVGLDCGFPLAALVTKHARDELALVPGAAVTAVVKASAIHLIPRS